MVLDVFPASSGMPILEAVSLATPIVTLPSLQAHTRLAAAVCKRIGIADSCIAQNASLHTYLMVLTFYLIDRDV